MGKRAPIVPKAANQITDRQRPQETDQTWGQPKGNERNNNGLKPEAKSLKPAATEITGFRQG